MQEFGGGPYSYTAGEQAVRLGGLLLGMVVCYGPVVAGLLLYFFWLRPRAYRVANEQARRAGQLARLVDLEADEAEFRRQLRERRRRRR